LLLLFVPSEEDLDAVLEEVGLVVCSQGIEGSFATSRTHTYPRE
jgi:hypothetical protein